MMPFYSHGILAKMIVGAVEKGASKILDLWYTYREVSVV